MFYNEIIRRSDPTHHTNRPGSIQGHGVLWCDRAQGHDILFLVGTSQIMSLFLGHN